ncbi:e3 ubiquitin-protein ligase [Anaeramoeba flamelloides]|uniref:E3 ubiquitin-protein ligase n=1 Tax=Anaeramoeba flamelloides TaxID=1746091 RepID=A0ABQ8Y5Y4_9EUKA|nr:e3 ubiquitin-protein ligase [Anaeramoeba flamelloides]
MEITEEDLNCSLCLGLMTRCVVTNCGHCFCASCILDYFDRSTKCPLCRSEVFTLYPSYLLRSFIERKDEEGDTKLTKEEIEELDQEIEEFNEKHTRPSNLPGVLKYDFNILRFLMKNFNIYAILGWLILILLILYLLWTDDLVPLSYGIIGLADDFALILLAFAGLHFVVKYFEKKTREKYTRKANNDKTQTAK